MILVVTAFIALIGGCIGTCMFAMLCIDDARGVVHAKIWKPTYGDVAWELGGLVCSIAVVILALWQIAQYFIR